MAVRILIGDCRDKLRDLPDASVNCCVTSPPYFGLRDYGHEGQMGLEPTPDEFVAGMVEVFREVRRILRDDGTLWLNIGDSYAGGGSLGRNDADRDIGGRGGNKLGSGNPGAQGSRSRVVSLKPKDLIGIPWMLAFALRADGWFLRQEIIWHKPNPMPESVTDRCTKAHESIFLLSKSPRYYFDADAIAEPIDPKWEESHYKYYRIMGTAVGKTNSDRLDQGLAGDRLPAGKRYEPTRNKRSVWTVATQPFSEAHFATYPPALIEPCILAGCPKGGTVLDPFGGAGTTGMVADRFGRNAILVELNPEYAALAEKRLSNDGGMFADVRAA